MNRDILSDDWNDEDLELSLESARRNLIRLRKEHPAEMNFNDTDLQSPVSKIAVAKDIHEANKSKSMQTVAIESYCRDLNISEEGYKLIHLLE